MLRTAWISVGFIPPSQKNACNSAEMWLCFQCMCLKTSPRDSDSSINHIRWLQRCELLPSDHYLRKDAAYVSQALDHISSNVYVLLQILSLKNTVWPLRVKNSFCATGRRITCSNFPVKNATKCLCRVFFYQVWFKIVLLMMLLHHPS